VPLRIELGPRDLSSDSFVMTLRTGGKDSHPIDSLEEIIVKSLEGISTEFRARSTNLLESKMSILKSLPKKPSDLAEGMVFEVAFDGNDADAEKLEKSTNLTLLGDSLDPYNEPRKCIITGKETFRRQHLARMY